MLGIQIATFFSMYIFNAKWCNDVLSSFMKDVHLIYRYVIWRVVSNMLFIPSGNKTNHMINPFGIGWSYNPVMRMYAVTFILYIYTLCVQMYCMLYNNNKTVCILYNTVYIVYAYIDICNIHTQTYIYIYTCTCTCIYWWMYVYIYIYSFSNPIVLLMSWDPNWIQEHLPITIAKPPQVSGWLQLWSRFWSRLERCDFGTGAHMSCGYGSMPIHTIFRGMNIHLPAILMFTMGIGFWPIPMYVC